MTYASENATPVFEKFAVFGACGAMLSAQEILDAIERLGVGRADLAKALGVSQPNATRLYKPDPRTGKTRELSYEEGRRLIEIFNIDSEGEAQPDEPAFLNEELLEPIVREIVEASRGDKSASAARPLASALSLYLRQIVSRPAIHASQDALEAVAQSVVPLPRGSKRPT